MTVGRKPLDTLLAAVCHGTADRSQMEELAELLRHDKQAMDQYLLHVDLHVALATEPALGRAGPGYNTANSTRRERSLVRRRRRAVQALSVAAVAVSLIIAALISLERDADFPKRSVVAPAEHPVDFADVPERVPSVVIDETTVLSAVSVGPWEADRPERDAELPRNNTRWASSMSSTPTRIVLNGNSAFRLLPAHDHLPLADRIDEGRQIAVPLLPSRGAQVDLELRRSGAAAENGELSPPPWPSFVPGASTPAERPPLWRRDLDSQLSMNMKSLTPKWRKIDEK